LDFKDVSTAPGGKEIWPGFKIIEDLILPPGLISNPLAAIFALEITV
jgi:hypothetical protein